MRPSRIVQWENHRYLTTKETGKEMSMDIDDRLGYLHSWMKMVSQVGPSLPREEEMMQKTCLAQKEMGLVWIVGRTYNSPFQLHPDIFSSPESST